MKRWSKLQKELYLIIDPDLDFQIHCAKYRMNSQYGSTELPRYWITLGKEIIFDYPKQFIDENGNICDLNGKVSNCPYPYKTDISEISGIIREYIDTPKNEIFDKSFEDDHFGIIPILKASDKRIGKKRLEILKNRTENKVTDKIIDLRSVGDRL